VNIIRSVILLALFVNSNSFAFADVSGSATPQENPAITIINDVVYGQGIVAAATDPHLRDLKLDAYLPDVSDEPTAAIILAFGGAFHRGSRGQFQFSENGARDSSMADYCMALAQRGYACFSIDYRLTPDDPELPSTFSLEHALPPSWLENPQTVDRIETVRKRMGLPPLDENSRAQLYNATFAGVADAKAALDFVRDNASTYNIKPDKIAVGGFSAGASTMLNLAYALNADVSGVVSLSGAYWGFDISASVESGGPPALLFVGQWDLPGIILSGSAFSKILRAKGITIEEAWVPGFSHFYPMEAPSLGESFSRESVIDRIAVFMSTLDPVD